MERSELAPRGVYRKDLENSGRKGLEEERHG